MTDCAPCASRHRVGTRADVDNTPWDGPAAMSLCAKSNTPATCYGAICAGRKAGDSALQSSWSLPHHAHPASPPNAGAVRAALSVLGGGRGGVQGLTNRAASRDGGDGAAPRRTAAGRRRPCGPRRWPRSRWRGYSTWRTGSSRRGRPRECCRRRHACPPDGGSRRVHSRSRLALLGWSTRSRGDGRASSVAGGWWLQRLRRRHRLEAGGSSRLTQFARRLQLHAVETGVL